MDFVVENSILKGALESVDADHKLSRLIYDALNECPDHVAQIDAESGEKTTCGEMKERSIRCAVWMKKLGIGPDDIVVAVTHNHLDSCVPVFATFFVDAIFSAWYYGLTLYSARRFMKKFLPKLIFTYEKAAGVLVEAANLENLEVTFVVFGKHSEAQSLDEILKSQTSEEVEKFVLVNEKSPQDVAAVMLSSGTTGFPKGVMLSNKSLIAMAGHRNNSSGVTLKLLWYSTVDWISSVVFLLKTVFERNTRIITGKINIESFFQIVQNYKVHFALVPPILAHYVSKSALARNYDLLSLNTFTIGGCKHSRTVFEGLQRNLPTTLICNLYGTTELGKISSTTPKSKCIESVGFVAANCQIKFVDLTSDEVLGPNQKGEIRVKKLTSMIGYYKDLESTRQAFDEEGWYRTGDIGYYNETGEIFIVDRIKEIMKCKYYHVSPAEIEELLLSHPAVQEAVVVAIPHDLDGDWPAAFVTKIPGSRVTKDELMKLTSILEDYKKLRGGIYFIDSLPRSGSGKVAKHELRQLAINLKSNGRY